MQRILAPILPLFLLSVGACDPGTGELDAHDAPEAAEEAQDAAAEPVAAAPGSTLVREVQLSETHVIRFLALEDGTGAVEESFHVDLDHGSALPQDGTRRSLAELHRVVLPDEPVPAELLAIDEFTAEHADEPPMDDGGMATGQAESVRPFSAAPETTAACVGLDWEADRQWFLGKFCTEGTYKDCVANWTAINSWRHDTGWFKVSAFNQSVEAAAYVNVGHLDCAWDWWAWENKCSWKAEYTKRHVPTRTVQTYWWTGNGRRYVDIYGYGECVRVGMAQMWNPPNSGGGGGVSQNPAGACNYLGEACCPQYNVAGSYCDATYDAQLVCKGGSCQH